MITTFGELNTGDCFVTEEDYYEKYLLLYRKISSKNVKLEYTGKGMKVDGSDHVTPVNAIRMTTDASYVSFGYFDDTTPILVVL